MLIRSGMYGAGPTQHVPVPMVLFSDMAGWCSCSLVLTSTQHEAVEFGNADVMT